MTKKPFSDYDQFFALSRQNRVLQGVESLLTWDQETYMPSGAAGIRAVQLEHLAGLIHREKTSKKIVDHLSKLIDIETGTLIAKDLSAPQEAAVKLWRRDYLHTALLPKAFVEEMAKVTSQSIAAWQFAKKENAFQQFAPFLDRIISLQKQKADYLGYKDHSYDALLDEYEPGMTTAQVDLLFAQIKKTLTPFIKKIASKSVEDNFLFGDFASSKQLEFGNKILNAIGYDFTKGRLDLSSHPFSSASHPSDSRITTRIHPKSLMSNIFVVLHEAGHALYEMGLPEEHYGSPLGESQSLGIHESQSRFWETRIGMSEAFWRYYFPVLKETFKDELEAVSFDSFYLAIHKVRPSFIRVEADELTYPLHVILRFELEKALIEGTLTVRELPDAWNAQMEANLGIIPPTNREGCLQDIHWAWGSFGYFPTYSLGNMFAANLFEAFEKDHPNWQEAVSSGEFGSIKVWLHEHIYRHGRRYSSLELIENATGHSFSATPYLRYLKDKYERLYGV